MEYFLLYGFALIAEIAGTISGFGSSSIFLPIAHQFFDYKTALLLVAIYHIFGNASRLMLNYHHWDKRIFTLFGIPSIGGTLIGVALIEYANPDILKIILAIVLILFALYSLWKPRFQIRATPLIGRVGGVLSGFTAGLIGTGGVLRGACMTLFGLTRERYVATIASIALLVDVTRVPIYLSQGFLSREYFFLIPILFCIAWSGSWIGKKIVEKLPSDTLKKIILLGIIVMSIFLVKEGIYAL